MEPRCSRLREKSLHHQHGTAAIELGILIVPLLLMLFGVTEFGRAIYQYNTLAKSVRDASRYLSLLDAGDQDTDLNGTPDSYNNAKCLAVYGNIGCTGATLLPGLTKNMVKICDADTILDCPGVQHAGVLTGEGSVNLVTVKITGYEFHSLVNFSIGDLTIGAPDITFDPIFNTMRQS